MSDAFTDAYSFAFAPANALPRISPGSGAASAGPVYLSGWDLVVIGGVKLPGINRVTKGGLRLKKDPNEKAGANGGRPIFHGLEAQEFTVSTTVWTDAQLAALQGACKKILPVPGKDPQAFAIQAPQIILIAAGNMTLVGATPLTWHTSPQCPRGLEMSFQLLHWLAADKKGKTVQPKGPVRKVDTTRPFPLPGPSSNDEVGGFSAPPGTPYKNPAPTSTSGTCGPPATVH